MRRYMSKPRTYGVSEFTNCLSETNKQLASYPDTMDSSKLSLDKIVEILEFAPPPEVWRKHMILNQFVPSKKTLKEVVDFFWDLKDVKASGKAKGLKPNASNKTKRSKRRVIRMNLTPPTKKNFICPIHGSHRMP